MEKKEDNVKWRDAIIHVDMTPEEREVELQRLKEESEKLTDWSEF